MQLQLIDRTENSIKIGLLDADTTILMPIIEKLNENKDVKIVRFINKHPELEDTGLYVEMRQGSPIDAIKAACDTLSDYFSECKTA